MLTNIQKLALENATVKCNRSEVAPGTYVVAPFTVEVSGTFDVGENETYTPTAEIPLIPTVALALKKMGIQREHFMKVLRECVNEALLQDRDTRASILAASGIAEFETEFRQKVLANLPLKTRNGKVRVVRSQVTPIVTGIVL